MKFIYLFLAVILLLSTASGGHASLFTINLSRLPAGKDVVELSADLKVLETVAENWSPEWRHELPKRDAVSLAERTLEKIDVLLSSKDVSAGELLLLKGLTAHYAYNLDVKNCFDVAVESLRKARQALPGDCRPLWLLGNHYAKSGDAEKGMPLLKQSVNECGNDLPLSFWEDYSYAAVLAAMPATGQYALDQVKTRNLGALTDKTKAVEEGVKKRFVSSDSEKDYEPDDIWHFRKYDGVVRLVNGMYGFRIDLPGDWRVSPFGVRNSRSGIGITLPKKGKWPPPLEVVIFVTPASPEVVPEKVLRTFLANTKKSFNPIAGPDASAGKGFFWIESKQKKGSRLVAGILRRPQPAYPGLLLESPQNIPKPENDQQAPRYYSPVKQLTRLPGNLDYLVMVEGAPAAFDKGRADLELLLRNLVIE